MHIGTGTTKSYCHVRPPRIPYMHDSHICRILFLMSVMVIYLGSSISISPTKSMVLCLRQYAFDMVTEAN